ncbi:hypothetical protein VINI7043_24292, partial [Vibrio nigripulchritudo ATCC 27043]
VLVFICFGDRLYTFQFVPFTFFPVALYAECLL